MKDLRKWSVGILLLLLKYCFLWGISYDILTATKKLLSSSC